jgi:hypothetical protein
VLRHIKMLPMIEKAIQVSLHFGKLRRHLDEPR